VVWRALSPHDDVYIAIFNLNDPAAGAANSPVPIKLAELGINGPVRVRDLWRHSDLDSARDEFAPTIPGHGAGLYRLTPA
jgi:alpha-galactosidase